MIFSTTGIAYLLLFISSGFLTYRFFQYWQSSKDIVSKCFLCLVAMITLFALVKTIIGLFFTTNIPILQLSTAIGSFIQGVNAAIVTYLIMYLKFPKISPWVGFWTMLFLGMTVTALFFPIAMQSQPTVDAFGAIKWGFIQHADFNYIFIMASRMFILVIGMVPIIIILIQQSITTGHSYVRKKAFGLSVVLSLGVLIGLLDFVLVDVFGLKSVSRDIVTGFLSIILFFLVFFTQKPPVPEKPQEKHIPLLPKISW